MRPRRVTDYYGIDAVPGFVARMSSPAQTHVPELAGLRGIAILTVVMGHLLQRVERFYGRETLNQIETFVLAILATPFSGCRLLFCITGYTVAIYINRNINKDRPFIDVDFLKKRLLRLWPPYAMILLATFIFIRTTGYEPSNTYHFRAAPESMTLSLIASLLYLHDLIFNTFPRLFPPGWYLEAHLQFLLVAPLLFRPYAKLKSPELKLGVAVAALLVSTVLAMIASEHGSRGIQYSIIAFFPYFLVGALVAEFRHRESDQRLAQSLQRVPLGLLGLTMLILLGAPWGAMWWQLPAQLLAIAAIMTACLVGQSRFRSAMSDRHLTRIGIASFSIYLVHLQILQIVVPIVVERCRDHPFLAVVFICGTIGTGLVLALSFVFYWVVERPFVAFSLQTKRSFPTAPRPA
ncbi:acyltransferase family protein [Bosea sp. BH3]|uniref:acyltransferase family protein n=1 Tax=Bosea sp. BH3 TaxID=2871701 RepID=UPI0021CB93A4|nr:acyltransferase [Bosea sp. BH3]MCU4178027.1 acyltransferase [Bosea sp. BH3]